MKEDTTEEVITPEVMPDNLPAETLSLHVDFDALKGWITAKASRADGLEPTAETKAEAKRIRAELAGLRDKCKEAKTKVRTALLAPLEPYEKAINDLIEIVESKRIPLDNKIKAIDEALKAKQREDLTKYLRTLVDASFPDEAMRTAEYWNGLIDANPKLTNISTSLKSAKEFLAKTVEDRKNELEVIRSTYSLKGPDYVAKAELEFSKTFNQAETMRRVNEFIREEELIAERRRRAEQEERERQAAAAAKPAEAPAPVVAPDSGDEGTGRTSDVRPETGTTSSVRQQDEEATGELKPARYVATLKITATVEQLKGLKAYILENGMAYEKVGEVARIG